MSWLDGRTIDAPAHGLIVKEKMTHSATEKSPLAKILIFIGLIAAVYGFVKFNNTISTRSAAVLAIKNNPTITYGRLGAGEKIKEYTFFDLPNGLNKAQIHDIVFVGDAMWLGTDKGLVKIVDQDVTIYKQFSDWPFEWVRNLVATPHGLVVSVHVAMGNTGGESANSHVFNIEDETWQNIGPNVLAQAWLDGHLYQAGSKLTRRDPKESWEEQTVIPSICRGGSTSLKIKAIANELWVTGQGDGFGLNVDDSFGCGVIRYNPINGQSIVYSKKNGLNHDKGWDLDGDDKGIYVSHSIKHYKLSFYDFTQNMWKSVNRGGAGNRIAVSAQSVWLARGSPRPPLGRIDRENNHGPAFSAISDSTYISSIGVDDKKVWLGTYEKHWADSTYSITSRLGLVVEPQ